MLHLAGTGSYIAFCILTLYGLCSSLLLGCVRAICWYSTVHCRKNAPQPAMY